MRRRPIETALCDPRPSPLPTANKWAVPQTKRQLWDAVHPERQRPRHAGTQLIVALVTFTPLADSISAAESWWQTYTPVATLDQRGTGLETIQSGAARGGTGTLGWYGFWFLDEQDKAGVPQASRQKLQQAGVKRILYYDLGEVGVSDKPGVTYWRKAREATAARRLVELLQWPDHSPRLETDAPGTVGVNLNLGDGPAGPLLTLDLNNCDLDVEADTIHSAPACTTTIRLPAEWRGPGVQVSYATPEQPADSPLATLTGDAAVFDPAAGTLRLRTPSFTTYMIVFCRRQANTEPLESKAVIPGELPNRQKTD